MSVIKINDKSHDNEWHIIYLGCVLPNALKQYGEAQAIRLSHMPMIAITPLVITIDQLTQWQKEITKASVLFIASQHGVTCAPASVLNMIKANATLKVVTMGLTSSLAATALDLTVFYTPPRGTTSEKLLEAPFLQAKVIKDQTIVILAGLEGRQVLAQTLAQRGARIHWCHVYQQEKVTHPLPHQWSFSKPHCFIATSQNILENLLLSTPPEIQPWIKQQYFIVISERIALYAKKCGIQHIEIAKGADADSIIEALHKGRKFCDTVK